MNDPIHFEFVPANGQTFEVAMCGEGDSLALCPPLIIDEAEINALFDGITRALDRTHAWLSGDGNL